VLRLPWTVSRGLVHRRAAWLEGTCSKIARSMSRRTTSSSPDEVASSMFHLTEALPRSVL
jgi:hypothetical protein